MNLFERVLAHVKSVGHAIESEEHKLLNEFAAYISSKEAVFNFLKSKNLHEDAAAQQVVGSFAAQAAPAPEPVNVEPTPVLTPAAAPADPAPAVVAAPVVDSAPAPAPAAPVEAPVADAAPVADPVPAAS